MENDDKEIGDSEKIEEPAEETPEEEVVDEEPVEEAPIEIEEKPKEETVEEPKEETVTEEPAEPKEEPKEEKPKEETPEVLEEPAEPKEEAPEVTEEKPIEKPKEETVEESKEEVTEEKPKEEQVEKTPEKTPEKPLEKKNISKEMNQDKSLKKGKPKVDVAEIAQEIMDEQIKQQRGPIKEAFDGTKEKEGKISKRYIKTGIEGFDALLNEGIPKKSSVLVAGGAGCGKTIFCLQTMVNKARQGKKCLYMSFEEKEDNLVQHMEGLGFEPKKLIDAGNLKINRTSPFDITRNVDAMLAKQKGELLIEIDPVIIPRDFKPDFIFLDSLTAIASAFTGKEESYRIYIEQLFRFFEDIGATSFLITETEQIPKIFSKTGVEEFLADGVIVMYNLKQRNVRENAIEILKLRGAGHQKKIVALQITSEGIVIYPEQEVFSEME